MALRKRLLVALGLLLTLIILSVIGYRLLGGSSVTFLQALYMAVITVASIRNCNMMSPGRAPSAFRIYAYSGEIPLGAPRTFSVEEMPQMQRALAYGEAGATDLMVGFVDFPDTTMLERFAKRVLPVLTARPRIR